MRVKDKYCSVSESFLYELSMSAMKFYKHYYAYWMSVKNLLVSELTFEDTVKLDKIEQLHKRMLK